MAVSSFEIGKLYKVNLALVQPSETCYCSYLKVNCNGAIIEYRGNISFYFTASDILLVWDESDDNILTWGADDGAYHEANISGIEFVANANTVGSEQGTSWKNACSMLSSQFSQVSVYNEHSAQWVDLPCASEYTGIATTLVDSGRNAKGVVIGDVIATDIAKVEMKWNFLTLEQYSMIAQLFEPKYNGSFMNAVRFFDVVKGDFDGDNSSAPNYSTNPCRVMYCGDRKVQFAKMKLDNDGRPIGYQGVSLNLIDTHKIYGE